MPKPCNLSPDATRLLVQLAGEHGVIFEPYRRWETPAWGALSEARRLYASQGLPYKSGASTPLEVKQAVISLGELSDVGMVVPIAERVKTVRVIVSEGGDLLARNLTGLWGLSEAVDSVNRLHSLRSHADAQAGSERPWINEYAIAFPEHRPGKPYPRDAQGILKTQQASFQILWRRGWAEFHCTTKQAGYWRLTPAGVDVAEGRITPEPEFTAPHLSDDEIRELADLWTSAAESARTAWRGLEETSQEIGPPPLSPFVTNRHAQRHKVNVDSISHAL